MSKLASLLATLAAPIAALLGALLAWLWVEGAFWFALLAVIAVVLIGCVLYWIGVRRIPVDPKGSIPWLECRALALGGMAAAASALVIHVAIWLSPGDKASDGVKEILGAVSGAIAVALAALFIDASKEAGSKWLADPIKGAFQEVFKSHQFDPEQPAAVALYDDEGGWGFTERRRRAKEIADDIGLPVRSP
ncbi:hypothetical protein [Streptomyces sp. NBC_00878]|uniref:hypothetical protein n=1 Tax=Streptomyces sp. NBC_00878 TaxID=2975854 RepID=UPI0022586BEA|nr:hypothetical protein [Streptomyces sp. NBC_00878]MCX4908329.1 hypothetical protein [Streptomyces sp. NBC_00878]